MALERRFDLVISVEKAEHLQARRQASFVSRSRHGDVVLFSAAIPFQGGHHHVNEQFPDYWVERFAAHGHQVATSMRPRIWTDTDVLWWLRQNVLVFARGLERHPRLCEELSSAPSRSSCPTSRARRAREAGNSAVPEHHEPSGTTFKVTRMPDGRLTVEKTG